MLADAVCMQVFWPSGAKGESRRGAWSGEGGGCASVEAEWRPSSQLVMALGANSKRGQMLREARGLHSALRTQLEPPRARAVEAVYLY